MCKFIVKFYDLDAYLKTKTINFRKNCLFLPVRKNRRLRIQVNLNNI